MIERIAILSPNNDEEKISNIVKESLKSNEKEKFSINDNFSIPLKKARENFEKSYLTSNIYIDTAIKKGFFRIIRNEKDKRSIFILTAPEVLLQRD